MKKAFLLTIITNTAIAMLNLVEVSAQYAKLDSLVTVLITSNEDTNYVNRLNEIAYIYHDFNLDSSLALSIQALHLAEKIKWQMGIGKSFHNLGIFTFFKGNFDLSFEYYFKAISVYNEIEKSAIIPKSQVLRLKSGTMTNIGLVYQAKGDYLNALNFYFKALKIMEEIGDRKSQAITLGRIADVSANQGDLHNALSYDIKALKIVEELGDKIEIAKYFLQIGNLYYDLGDYPKGFEYDFKALELTEELGNKLYQAQVCQSIGNLYYAEGNYPEVLSYYFKALKLMEEIGNKYGISESCNSIANSYSGQNDYPNALEYYFKALKMVKDLGDKYRIANELVLIGDIYFKQNKFKESEKYLHDALKLATEIKALDLIKKSNLDLSELYRKQGDWKKAFEYQIKYISARDSINNEEKAKTQTRLEMNYEFDKKEAATKAEQDKKDAIAKEEIARQKLTRNFTTAGFSFLLFGSGIFVFLFNQKRKSQFKNKVSEVEMRALRSQINPHFIFNSLNSIDDYVQRHEIENSSLYINKFSRLMRKILEHSRSEQVLLKEDLDTLELYIQIENLRMQNKVTYSITISPDVNAEQLLIQPMLLQPFVENAFKHAFTGVENPKLEIKVGMKNEMIHCEVLDNGKGRDSKQEVMFKAKDKEESLGLKVTQERLDIINKIKKSKAYITFEDLKDVNRKAIGTRVELAVPVSYVF